jgi:hypothetical protein
MFQLNRQMRHSAQPAIGGAVAALAALLLSGIPPEATAGAGPAAPEPAAASLADADFASTADSDKPWFVNLNLYMWLAGAKGDYTAGPFNTSVDKNFIDIVGASHRFPLGFMGRLEAGYDRFGVYLDGNWMDLNFKRKTGPYGQGGPQLDSTLGILDYGVSYRIAGPAYLANFTKGQGGNRADLYVGGRTIWLDNSIDFVRIPTVSASKTFNVPVIGGRFSVDFGRDWFVRADGNIGGFGADNVDFSGGIQGAVGYRLAAVGVPLAIELGYKALRLEVDQPGIETRTTLNGPFLGGTFFW